MGKQRNSIEASIAENRAIRNSGHNINPLITLEDSSKYDKGLNAAHLNSLDDYRESKQSTLAAFGNSLVKNSAKAGLRFVDGALGIGTAVLYDIPDFISDGAISNLVEGVAGDVTDNKGDKREGFSGFLESIYDNAYSENVTRPMEKWLDEMMPVYQNKSQKEGYGILNMGFLDKALDGVAYIAGMAGGAKFASLGVKGLGKAAKLISSAAREGKDLNYVKSMFSSADDLLGELGKSNKSPIKEFAKNAWDDLFGAVVESGAEASETKKTIFENLKKKALEENGGRPLTKEELDTFDKQASVGGASNFMINLVTTGVTNNLVFKPLLKTKWLDDALDNKALKNELIDPTRVGKKGAEYILQKANANQKLYKKLFNNAKNSDIIKNAGLEASQELTQFASGDYFVNLLSDPSQESIDGIGDLYDITAKRGLQSMLKTAGALTSVDAVHSALIGGILGGGSGALQSFANRGQVDKNTQYAIDYANRNTLQNKDVTSAIKAFAKAKEHAQISDAAAVNGDRVSYETSKYLGFANYINARVNMGKFEDVLEDLKELKTKPIEEFKTQFDLNESTSFDSAKRDKMIDYAVDVANQIKKSQENIMSAYGHKINALESKSPDNERIFPFLTSLDALKANYINRENSLIDKFKANGVDYSAFQKKEKSAEEVAAAQGRVAELTSLLSLLQNDKNMPMEEKLAEINNISNQIVKANDDLQRTVTEDTYKELFKKELTDEYKPHVDQATQKSIYEVFGNDLKDFTQIQTAKEGVINLYSKIVNDENYAEKVAKKLKLRSQDDEIGKLFTVSGNVVNNPIKSTKKEKNAESGLMEDVESLQDNYEFEEGDAKSPESHRENYIKVGDVYSLNRKVYKHDSTTSYSKNAQLHKNKGELYEMFEVMDTKTSINPNGQLKGEVQISNNKGYKEWLDVRDFKKMIKPIGVGADASIKLDARTEEHQFYQKFKNSAVRFTKNGVVYVGKIALPYAFVNEKEKSVFAKASTYDIVYVDNKGDKQRIQGVKFEGNKFRKDNITSIEILNDELSTLVDLKLNVEKYIEILTKSIATKVKNTTKYEQKLADALEGEGVYKLSEELKDLAIQNIEHEIAIRNEDVVIMEAAIKNLERYKNENFELDVNEPLPDVIKDALEELRLYREANNELKELDETDESTILKAKLAELKDTRKAIKVELDEANLDITELLSKDNAFEDSVKNTNPDSAVEAVVDYLEANEIDDANAKLIDVYKRLLQSEIDINNLKAEIETKFYETIASKTGLVNPKVIKYGELNSLISLWKYTNNKGFRYSTGYGRAFVKDYQEEYDSTIERENEGDVIKSIGVSDITNINDKGLYAEEKRNFFKYFYKVPVDTQSADPNDALQLEVEVDGDVIYLKFEHDGLPMVTTLAATSNVGSPLHNFRELLKEQYELNKEEGLPTYVTPSGKISLFDASGVNKPIDKVFSDINLDIIVAQGVKDAETVQYDVNGVTYQLRNGRLYLANEKLGILQPVVVGTLDEAVISRTNTKGVEKTFTLTDVVVNYLNFLKVSKLVNSQDTHQANIGKFYHTLNSFLYTVHHSKIGVGEGMKKGAIDIIEQDGEWGLVYLDENNEKLIVEVFDENNEVTDDFKKQIGRRLFNPRLESENFKYDSKFIIPVSFYMDGGVPKLQYRGEEGYTYSQFVKESGGLQSNLQVQNIEGGEATYFKGGYFKFDENSEVSNVKHENSSEYERTEEEKTKDLLNDDGDNPMGENVNEDNNSQSEKESLEIQIENLTYKIETTDDVDKVNLLTIKLNKAIEELEKLNNNKTNKSTPVNNPFDSSENDEESSDIIDGGFGLGIISGIGSKINNDFAPISLDIANTYRLENITQKEVNEAKTKFENDYGVNFELVNGLINDYSWGRVTEAGGVLLSDSAPMGTTYHEEFHLVSQHILSSDELNDLYKTARVIYGDKSDYELEETLAEGYRMFATGYKGFTGKIAYYFNKLLNIMKSLIGIKNTPIEQLYKDILFGKYYGKPVYKGTVKNNETLNYDEKQMVLGSITKGVINLIKNHAYANDENSFIKFIDDSYYREKLIKYELKKEDVIGDNAKKLITRNPNLINFYFNNSIITYVNHLQSQSLLLSKLEATYGKNENQLLQDAKAYFNNLLKTTIEEEINEEEQNSTNQIVKKGDTEVDFFTNSLTKLRLLIVSETDGTHYGSLNPSKFMTMIYNHIRDAGQDISEFSQFEKSLKAIVNNHKNVTKYGQEYVTGLNNIMKKLKFEKTLSLDTNPSVVRLQNLLFEVFSKVENEYQVMKVISEIEDGKFLTNRAFVNQTVAKRYDDTLKKTHAAISNYLLSNQPELLHDKLTHKELADFANKVFNTTIYAETDFKNSAKRSTMIQRLLAITQGQIGVKNGDKILNKSNIKDVLSFSKSSIDNVVEEITKSEGLDKIFNLRNAEGAPQHSLSNYSSLYKRLQEYKGKENTVRKNLQFDSLVYMNGIQTKGDENESIIASKLTKNDILIYYINSVLKDKVVPYAFSGDKSTLLGIRTSGDVFGIPDDAPELFKDVYNKLLDKEVNFIKKFDGKLPYEGMSLELPLFQFLNESDYNALKKNPDANRESAIKKLIKHIDEQAESLYKNLKEDTGESPYTKEQLVKFFHIYRISVAEQTNELIGSFNFYKDFAKRAFAMSSTKSNLRLDKNFVEWYNKVYDIGFPIKPTELKTLVLNDVRKRKEYLKDLGNFDNAADAQGYMYYNSARFMLQASGRWNEKLDIIFKDLDRLEAKTTLIQADIDNHNNLITKLNEQISVLKPQYFGFQKHNNEVDVPTFYKFSVLPLSKVLTQNKNLDKIRKVMKKNGIDMVVFESANKVGRRVDKGTLNMYDANGNITLNDNIDVSGFVQTTDWKYMGVQVEMSLAHSTVTFGTQMRKLITESMPEFLTIGGEKINGQDIIKTHEALIIKKIEQDTEKFKAKFGLNGDFNLKEINKNEEFRKQLIQQATSREVPDSFIQSLRDNQSWDYIMNKSTLQNILNSSVRNGIISQKMNGDAKAMVSAVGFEKENDAITYDKRLKFYEAGEGGSDAMEVFLPYEFIKGYEKYVTFKDGVYELDSNAPARLTELIGFRIPTQGHASIDKIRIKGFLPKGWGNAVVVPFELSQKAGSDFDIDKLNLFFPKFKANRSEGRANAYAQMKSVKGFDTKTYSKVNLKILLDTNRNELSEEQIRILDTYVKLVADNTPLEYDETSINNEILSLYNNVLGSPEYRELLMTSIDNNEIATFIKEKIEVVKNIKKEDAGHLLLDPVKAAERRYSFMSAKATLASVALHGTHHAESQKHNLGFNIRVNGVLNQESGFDLAKLIKVFKSGLKIVNDAGGYDKIQTLTLANINSPLVRNGKIVKISDLISQFMNATVDAAKDDYITSANFDLETVNVALMLIRLGLDPREVLMFISNPSIVEYTKLKKARKDLSYNTFEVKSRFNIVKESTGVIKEYNEKNPSVEDLLNTESQDLLKTYIQLEKFSSILSDLMNLSNFDTKGNGKAIEENELRQKQFNDSKRNFTTHITNYESSISPANSFQSAFREVAFKANTFTGLAFGLNSLYGVSKSYTTALNEIAYNKELKTNEGQFVRLNPDERIYKANRFKQMFLTGLLQANLLSKEGSMPDLNTYYKELKTELRKVKDIKHLNDKLRFDDNAQGISGANSITINEGAGLSVDDSNRLTEDFEKLYRFNSDLAKKLVIYSIFKSGVINSPITIYHIIPDHIIKEVSLGKKNGTGHLFTDLLNNARKGASEELIASIVTAAIYKLGERKSMYENNMLTNAIKENIKICK